MRVTPLEIRQKSFEKVFRGYDKDEVNAFLLTLSQEWERMLDDQKEFRYKLESSEREVSKLREVENSLFKTLKTAEDTGANLVEQANKTAELHVREAQMKADAILFEAKNKAKNIIDDAELKSRQILEGMEDDVKYMEESYRNLQNHRDNLLADLRNLANDTLEKVDRASTKKKINIQQYTDKIKEVTKDLNSNKADNDEGEASQKEEAKYEQPQETTENKSGSFFDNIQ